MQSAITFDTLEFMEELKKSGMKHKEAESITKATARAFVQMMDVKDVATKKDIMDLKNSLQGFIVKAITSAIFILSGLQAFLHFIR